METFTFTNPIEMELGHGLKPISFKTPADVLKWVEPEVEKWKELRAYVQRSGDNWLKQQDSTAFQPLHVIESNARQLQNAPNNRNNENNCVNHIKNNLNYYVRGDVIHSSSTLSRQALKLFNETNDDSTKAVAAIAAFTPLKKGWTVRELSNNTPDIRSIITGVLAASRPKLRPSLKEEEEQHEALRADYFKTFEDLKTEAQSIFDTADETQKKSEATIEVAQQEYDELLSGHKVDHEAQVAQMRVDKDTIAEEYKSKINQLEKIYHADMQTQAPITYWKDRAKSHRTKSIVSLVAFILLATVTGASSFNYGKATLDYLQPVNMQQNASSTKTDPSATKQETTPITNKPVEQETSISTAKDPLGYAVSRILIFIFPAFLVVWLLRLIARLYLVNQGLADDAEERVTMVQTFVSLLEHEGKIDETDKIMMLQALFRPSAFAGDNDAAPPNWFDLLSNQVKKNKAGGE